MDSVKKELKKVAMWVAIACVFGAGIYFIEGQQKALEFFAGYVIELSLSMDNLFVFISIFMAYGLWENQQHKVLRYGIFGAFILRFIFIVLGVAIVSRFEWILYIFGAILIWNGIKMWTEKEDEDEEKDPHDSRIIKICVKLFPMTKYFVDDKFSTVEDGKKRLTPLFAVMVLVIFSDIIFAVDSVPAVLSVSKDIFIVYSSNMFALLGLWELFFVVEAMRRKFDYVKYGVGLILAFTGVKLLLAAFDIEIGLLLSIGIIIGVLALSIIISIVISNRKDEEEEEQEEKDL